MEHFTSTLETPARDPRDAVLTDLHVDYIMYLLETKKCSALMVRTAEIIITEGCSVRVAEELIVTLKGLQGIGVAPKTAAERKADRKASVLKDIDDTERANREAALAARGVKFV